MKCKILWLEHYANVDLVIDSVCVQEWNYLNVGNKVKKLQKQNIYFVKKTVQM